MLRSVLTATACAAAFALSASAAHADSDDDQAFLRALHQEGITDSGGDQAMITLGRIICEQRAEGYSQNAIESIGKLRGNSMSDEDVKVIVTSAEAAYCPEYIP